MHKSNQLRRVFSKKVLLIWHSVNIFLLVISLMVPMIYEASEADGLLSGPNNLLTFIGIYGLPTLFIAPLEFFEGFSQWGILQTLLFPLFINTGSISFLGYTGLKIISCFERWQWQLQLSFWLLGLACLWAACFGWAGRSDQNNSFLVWGFNVLVCALVSAVLWESVNYMLYRRRL